VEWVAVRMAGSALERYPSDLTPRISRLRRPRASASTWSFHRSVAHSGRSESGRESDGAVPLLTRVDSSKPRPGLGCAFSLRIVLDLNTRIVHLRIHSLMFRACRSRAMACMGIVTHLMLCELGGLRPLPVVTGSATFAPNGTLLFVTLPIRTRERTFRQWNSSSRI
jgi:hypothetical protein